jgi:hypothetical protein
VPELCLGIVRMFLFEPFKDNKIWRRVLSVACGFAFVVWGLVSIYKGQITAFRHYNYTFYEAKNTVCFWLVVMLVLYLGVGCIYRGIRGKR